MTDAESRPAGSAGIVWRVAPGGGWRAGLSADLTALFPQLAAPQV
jgi:hypothetical protein